MMLELLFLESSVYMWPGVHPQHGRNMIGPRSSWFHRESVTSFPARWLRFSKLQETWRLPGRRKSERQLGFLYRWRWGS